jgi:hypothetical protein
MTCHKQSQQSKVAGACDYFDMRYLIVTRFVGRWPSAPVAELTLGMYHHHMKTTLPIWCSVLLIAGVAWGQDPMTLEKFNTLVAAPGDTNAMRPELASFPFWKSARCSTVIKVPGGQVFTEESVQNVKTVGGKYVVFTMDSQFSKQPLQAVIGYDEKASAIKSWGIAGGDLVAGIVVFDPERRTTAFSSTHGEVMQISVGTYSDMEGFSRMLVYKNGVLSLTREVRLRPVKAEPDGAANGSQPIRSETNRTSSAAGSRR